MNKLRELADGYRSRNDYPLWQIVSKKDMEELWPIFFMLGCRKVKTSGITCIIHPEYKTVALRVGKGWEVYMLDVLKLLGEGDE